MKKIIQTLPYIILIILTICPKILAADDMIPASDITLYPFYEDWGEISSVQKTINATLTNNTDSDFSLTADLKGKGAGNIRISPSTLTLAHGEKKNITVSLINPQELSVGVYDLSVSFSIHQTNRERITTGSTNALRIVFKKPGIALASCSVSDIPPMQTKPFTLILANFTDVIKNMHTVISITSNDTGVVWYQYQTDLTMKSYPESGFYGNYTLPLPTNLWDEGSYTLRVNATSDTGEVFTYSQSFLVGIEKGVLKKVEMKSVRKGNPALFRAEIENIGSLPLHSSANIVVKDENGQEVYTGAKSNLIPIGDTKTLQIRFSTKNLNAGTYTTDYTVKMADTTKSGTITFEITQNFFPFVIVIFIMIVLIVIIIIFICCKRKCNCNRHVSSQLDQ